MKGVKKVKKFDRIKLDRLMVRYIFLIAVLILILFNYQTIFSWFGRIWLVLTPFISGIIIAYVLNILMVKFEESFAPGNEHPMVNAIRRPISIILSILIIILVLIFVIGLVVPQIYNVITAAISAIPQVISAIESFLDSIEQLLPEGSQGLFGGVESAWLEISNRLGSFGLNSFSGVINTTLSTVGSVTSFLINLFLAFIFAFYILMSKERLFDQFTRLVMTYTSEAAARRIFYVLTTIDESFTSFLTGEVIDATILGTLVTVGMWIFRFPYAGMIGVLTGVFALIPLLGAYISGAIGLVLISVQSLSQAFWFLLFIIIIQQIEGNIIYPRVVGSSLGLPGMWVLFAVTVGGGLMGIPGMLLGVPIASATYKILRRDVRERERYSLEERKKFIRDAKQDSFKRVAEEYEEIEFYSQ